MLSLRDQTLLETRGFQFRIMTDMQVRLHAAEPSQPASQSPLVQSQAVSVSIVLRSDRHISSIPVKEMTKVNSRVCSNRPTVRSPARSTETWPGFLRSRQSCRRTPIYGLGHRKHNRFVHYYRRVHGKTMSGRENKCLPQFRRRCLVEELEHVNLTLTSA
jgi:hypothetical protein